MSAPATPHLWQGKWLSDAELDEKIKSMGADIRRAKSCPFELRFLLEACQKLSDELLNKESRYYKSLEEILKVGFSMESKERETELAELSKFLRRADLEEKLKCEFGSLDVFDFRRPDYRRANYECWAPLGFLVHIAPTNAYSAGAWSVIEGLLSANVNFLKTGGSDEIFAQLFLSFLSELDPSGTIAPRIFACRISSSEQDKLREILSHADGVIVWGDEGAISGIRAISPPTARFIEWGPKISFAYFSANSLDDSDSLEGLAREVCRMEQQACSSPQCVFAESESREILNEFARKLSVELEKASHAVPRKLPGAQEQAEISSVVELCRLESCLGLTDLIEAKDGSWRILIDYSSELKASPLYRTIWVKPLMRDLLAEALGPFRAFLQTAGLAAKLNELAELSDLLVQAGVLRITRCGEMLESYSGEPHDGVYALQRYSKKISLQRGQAEMVGLSTFADLRKTAFHAPAAKIMGKEDFQAMPVDPAYGQLFFKSGGSSGEPKLSVFNYDDYHLQMEAAAHGLLAAGLDLALDRCMNLFFAGGLYGGFVSFFTILETLRAIQYPMAGIADTELVAQMIVSQKCNVLLGMPSYIIQLFSQNAELLKKQPTVEKIFYGGEHFNESQKRHLMREFGVKIIRSAGYGSVDAGPIGYQCVHCSGSVHHLHSRLHVMEILEMESDRSVPDGEPGRVVLSCLARSGQKIERYDLGDMARLVREPCPCGRRGIRFELLGRHGDVFRIGSAFFNYGKFAQILSEQFDYGGELQIVLRPPRDGIKEELALLLQAGQGLDLDRLRREILDNYHDLQEIVVAEDLLDLTVKFIDVDQFARTAGSGKLRRVVDERAI